MNTTTTKIDNINELLAKLPEDALAEVRDFTAYLHDRERRRKAFAERILKIERESDTIECNSVEEVMQAILNAEDEED